ncbi:hypothetical protein CY34DRAFT_802087 [Suillus luteus UH-Slu-Lm8-n1]|uniref:Uncharacterized protein n=1 Tax=Suillus luteus UH-Slu-Lm8-n1 TaxID=930992 RepID=A0A0D0ATJ3_9AGAM|nr:hypothetical protein CY34DRAFT_802087 [Suillus luteus UH-Slu-Lm8-n1]
MRSSEIWISLVVATLGLYNVSSPIFARLFSGSRPVYPTASGSWVVIRVVLRLDFHTRVPRHKVSDDVALSHVVMGPYVTRNSPLAPLLKRSAPDVPLQPMTSVWIESQLQDKFIEVLEILSPTVSSKPDYSTDQTSSTNSCARFAPFGFPDPSS